MDKKIISMLPLLQDAKFIVVDEDGSAPNADNLIDGWMKMWSTTKTCQQIQLLLFFNTKFHYRYLSEMFKSNKLLIHDYCTTDLDKIYENDELNLNSVLESIKDPEKTIVIINCLSSLIINEGVGNALRFVEKLRRLVSQLICIYRNDFVKDRLLSLDTLGTTYVKLGKSRETVLIDEIVYEVSLVHRKQGGGILKKELLITQNVITNEFKSEREIDKITPIIQEISATPEIGKPETTFRIDMNAREMKQRDQTPLPYLITPDTQPVKESQIHYIPDANDDYDEEDPDDDLPF